MFEGSACEPELDSFPACPTLPPSSRASFPSSFPVAPRPLRRAPLLAPSALSPAHPGLPLWPPQHCVWHCQPGCYCPPGQVLSADGALCVSPSHCGCLDLLSGERHRPGARLPGPDSCNYW